MSNGLAVQRLGTSPSQWRDWAGGIDGEPSVARFDRAILQRWSNTDAVMRQPALDHHLIVLHQGGAKRVQRSVGRHRQVADVAVNASTTVESGSVYRWQTEGPIAFAHLYVAPDRFAQIVGETFDRDPATVGFAESFGRYDPHVAQLFDLMLATHNGPDWAMIADYYLDALLIRLASISRVGGVFKAPPRLALAPFTVARVRDFIQANLGSRISLADLAEVAGYSRYHFVRAFKLSTGFPPYAYLLNERIAAARAMLANSDIPVAAVASRTGFASHAQFSTRFRELTGTTPIEYRRMCRGAGTPLLE